MRKIKVINTGRRVRERLGSRFLPNQEQILEVNSRQYLTLKAVKDFKVEIINNEQQKQEHEPVNDTKHETDDENNENFTDNSEEDTNNAEKDTKNESEAQDIQQLQDKINNSTVAQVINLVVDGNVNVDEAIAYEMVGKNRSTLIEKLEELKQGD